MFFLVRRDASIRGTSSPIERGLYAIGPDGSGLRQIAGPTQIASLLGVGPGDIFPFDNSSGHALDVSNNGSRIVFGANDQSVGKNRIFTINSDGTGLRQIFGPVKSVFGVGISGNGAKVGFHVVSDENIREGYVSNFDGTGQIKIASDTQFGFSDANVASDIITLTTDGSQLIFGSFAQLFNTDGSSVLQLGTSLDTIGRGFDGDGLFRATMDNNGTRFLFLFSDDSNLSQLALLEIDPTSIGEAPRVTEPMIEPPFMVVNDGSNATISSRVTTVNTIVDDQVPVRFLLDGRNDITVSTVSNMFDDGQSVGDSVADDGVFTNNLVRASSIAQLGPRTV